MATGKNVYYDVLDDVVNKYNNTKHSTIKMKPIDVKNNNYIDEHNEKDGRFKLGSRVRISKFKNIFAKRYTPNWSKEIFIVDKINDTVPYTYNIKDLNDEKIIGSFYDRELQKTVYNTKVTSIETQIAGLTKNTGVNLADITKLKAIDTNSFVTRTKFSADANALDDKIDGVEKKPSYKWISY